MLLTRALRKVSPMGTAVVAVQVAGLVRQHWQSLPHKDRERLSELMRQSRGKPSNLSKAERRELRKLIRSLRLPHLLRKGAIDAAVVRRQLRTPPE